MKIVLTLLSLIFLVSCHIDTNTTDPQVSTSIRSSKESGLFIREYRIDSVGSRIIEVNESWLEFGWKNGIEGNKVVKKKTGVMQLVLSISQFNLDDIKNEDYLIKWKIIAKNIGSFGSVNGIYFLSIKNKIPERIEINILRKVNEEFTVEKIFNFIKRD